MTRLKKIISLSAAMLFLLALLCAPTLAQQITATLTGTITDPNGAVVPGATVTATSTETGQSRSNTTDDEGRYTIPFLPPGTYNVSVEGTGFTRVTRENIRLEVAQTATIDISLSVTGGEVKVEIGGNEVPLLQTETSTIETTIEQKLVEDLPSVDRNIFSFVNLVPGAIDAGTATGNPGGAVGSAGNRNFFDSNFSVNGGRASSNDVLLDGVSNTIGDFNGVAISPPQDSIREFKVLSGIAPAEYGRTAGGIVTIATKAGTNKFHGALYEYFQDRELNANGFVRNRLGLQRINVNRSQFGGAIGGPVFLPRFGEGGPALYNGKNRTFFFFNYEARREDNPFSRELLTVPTTAQRSGDLSDLLGGNRTDILFAPGNPGGAAGTPVRFGQIFNPYGALVPYLQVNANGTTTQVLGRPVIPNNDLSVLPVCQPGPRAQACLDPVALNVLSYIPLPNATGTKLATAPGVMNNYVISDTTQFTRDIFAGRIDQKISDKQNLFGRFSYEVRHDQFPNFFNSPASNAREIRDQFLNTTFNHVYTLTSSVINNFRYGYTRVRANQRPNSQGFNPTTLGLPSYLAEGAANLQFPNFLIGGGTDAATLPGQINSDTIGGAGNDQPRDTHTLNNSVTIVRGSHTIKTGGEYRLLRFYPFQFFNPTGNFTFDRTFTRGPVGTASYANPATAGSALASFLLGLPSQAQREAIAPITIYHHYYAGYLQDDWRVTRKLTLNLGLRYDYETGTAESHRLVSSFDLDAAAPVQIPSNFTLDPAVSALNPGIRNLRGFLSFPEGAQSRTSKNRFAPRLGFAYSLSNKTTLRGGFGMFFLPQSLEPTTAQGVNFTSSVVQSTQTAQIGTGTIFLSDPFRGGSLLTPVSGNTRAERTLLGGTVVAVEPVRENPYTQQWSLVLQRQLARNLVFDVAYVGARGRNLPIQQLLLNQLSPEALEYARNNFANPGTCPTTANPNAACTTVAAFLTQAVPNPLAGQIPEVGALNGTTIARAQLLRPYPQYQGVTYFRPHVGKSNYHALQLNLQKRFSDGLSAVASYVWSKLLDTGGVGSGAAFLDPSPAQDVYNYEQREYSYSTLDVPHRFVGSFTYELPIGRGKRFGKDMNPFLNFFLGGFQISGAVTLQSGTPLLITQNGFVEVTGLAAVGNAVRRPNRVGANTFDNNTFRENARNNLPAIDPSAFARADAFTFGNSARTYDDIRRDPYRNVDFSLIKNFGFNDNRQKLQLRAEFLNAFNYVVFGTPVTNIDSPNFGLITTQGNRPRIIQLVGRFTF